MGILVKNSDFELLWGEEYPSIAFDNTSYSLAGEVETDLTATFSITDNNEEDVTDQCTITFNNEYVTVEENEGVYSFNCEGLEVGTYETTVTATYSYLSATVTATATINISVTEKQPTSISFDNSSYTMNGNEYATLTKAFTVTDDLENDVTSLCSYSFSPNDKGLYVDSGNFKVDSATAGIYSITVTATYGQLTNTATISMAVVDYPDSISFDSESYTMSGTEGDTITQSFTVTDDLNHDVTANCTITFSPNNTGLTASNGAFDASAVAEGTYSVTATATYQSGNGTTLTATATISMEIASASFDNKYLTFEALESGTFTLRIPAVVDSTYMTSVSYSTDNGTTWVDTTIDATAQTITTPTIAQGGKVLWKGIGTAMAKATTNSNYSFFNSSGYFNVEGNIMSLLYGDNFVNQTTFPSNSTNTLACLFYHDTSGHFVVSVENLVLPATTLTRGCYYNMFYNCTHLTTVPSNLLPATTLALSCYWGMFSSCTSLTTVPSNLLPATTLAQYCYGGMFSNCTHLTTVPSNLLPATTLAQQCYDAMFQGCTSLTTVPTLPATTLAKGCYKNMFSSCTSLTTVPSNLLPATTLAQECYGGNFGDGMFMKCTSLTTAPELPATTLQNYCYGNMFQGCTALTTAPELPATTLTTGCYRCMFYKCTTLNSVKILATTNVNTTNLDRWLSDTAASGTVICEVNPDTQSPYLTLDSVSGIPTGWTYLTPVQ